MRRNEMGWIIAVFLTIVILDSTFDFGKWAIGRYTEVSLTLSVSLLVAFSAILAGIVEVIHRQRRIREQRIEQYLHHKIRVWVRSGQKGAHEKSSLCPECRLFKPDTPDNCLTESAIHTLARLNAVALVVWECPRFSKEQE